MNLSKAKLVPDLAEEGLALRSVNSSDCETASESEPNAERYEPLLRAVAQVALKLFSDARPGQ
jgi:hypothetical protein